MKLDEYPLHSYDKIRYCDTDRQGHVNNALFSSFLETGRVELLYNPKKPLYSKGGAFVIAGQKLDLLSEIRWPGKIDIGTGLIKVGNSSIKLVQGLYQNGRLCATAETVIVQMDEASRGSKSLSDETRGILEKLVI
ncbi:MAG: acyl-CoA thioesterase [Gammaproteobacteria bacterium]|nr:MAG: acyl-CoA thioesterase [Gammaproteobacteria bacterium]